METPNFAKEVSFFLEKPPEESYSFWRVSSFLESLILFRSPIPSGENLIFPGLFLSRQVDHGPHDLWGWNYLHFVESTIFAQRNAFLR